MKGAPWSCDEIQHLPLGARKEPPPYLRGNLLRSFAREHPTPGPWQHLKTGALEHLRPEYQRALAEKGICRRRAVGGRVFGRDVEKLLEKVDHLPADFALRRWAVAAFSILAMLDCFAL